MGLVNRSSEHTHPGTLGQVMGETGGPAGVRERGFPGPALRGSQGDPVQGVRLAGHWTLQELKIEGPTICMFIQQILVDCLLVGHYSCTSKTEKVPPVELTV